MAVMRGEVVAQVVWNRVGGGLVSPQAFAVGGDKPRPYATLSTSGTVSGRMTAPRIEIATSAKGGLAMMADLWDNLTLPDTFLM